MNIFKTLIPVWLILSGSAFAASNFNINLHVKLIVPPCAIVGDSVINVDLGKVNAADLDSQPYTHFALALQDCPAGMPEVALQFSGETAGDANQFIKNTGSASNVAIELKDNADDKRITSGSSISRTITADKTANFDMKAKMVPLGGDIAGGTVKGVVEFTMFYP